MNDDNEVVAIKLRVTKKFLREMEEAAYCFSVSRNTAICQVLALDFIGQLGMYHRAALHSRAEQTRKELADEIANLAAKPMRKSIREHLASGRRS